jgi:hypothetical protein
MHCMRCIFPLLPRILTRDTAPITQDCKLDKLRAINQRTFRQLKAVVVLPSGSANRMSQPAMFIPLLLFRHNQLDTLQHQPDCLRCQSPPETSHMVESRLSLASARSGERHLTSGLAALRPLLRLMVRHSRPGPRTRAAEPLRNSLLRDVPDQPQGRYIGASLRT